MLLTDKTTFTEFLIEARRTHPEARGDLNGVLHSVAFSGFDGATRVNAPNTGVIFVALKGFEERLKEGLSKQDILTDLRQQLSHVARHDTKRTGAIGIRGIRAQQAPIVFHCGAAARCVDHNGIKWGLFVNAPPGIYIGTCRRVCERLLAHVVRERATTTSPRRDDHFAAEPREQSNRRLVDLRRQHLLSAAGQQRHTP